MRLSSFRTTLFHGLGSIGLVLLTTSMLQAQTPRAHELHITPGTESAPLPLDGLLDAPSTLVEVLTPPQFGSVSFNDSSFVPADEFWLAGGDQTTLRLNVGGAIEDLTIYLTPLRAEPLDNGESWVDFEEGGDGGFPGNWTPTLGDALLEVVSADEEPQYVFNGQWGYLATIPEGGDSGYYGDLNRLRLLKADGTESKGADAANGFGGIQLHPPATVEDGWTNLVAYMAPHDSEVPQVFVQVQLRVDTSTFPPGTISWYEMRAALSDDLSCSSCGTPWRPVSHEEPIFFEVWSGSRITGPPEANSSDSWALGFTLNPTIPGKVTTDWLEQTVRIGRYRVGVMDTVGLAGFRAGFDQFHVVHEKHNHSPRHHLGDDFEDGTVDGWDTRGTAGLSSIDPISGLWSLLISRASMDVAGSDNVIYDKSPDAATELSAQISFDLEDLNLQPGDQLELIKAGGSENLSGDLHLSLLLRRGPSGYLLRARARDNLEQLHKTEWFSLDGGTHRAAVHWRASTDNGNNGLIRLFVDGALVGESLNIDNDTKTIESVAYGAFNAHIATVPGVPMGALRIDDVISFH